MEDTPPDPPIMASPSPPPDHVLNADCGSGHGPGPSTSGTPTPRQTPRKAQAQAQAEAQSDRTPRATPRARAEREGAGEQAGSPSGKGSTRDGQTRGAGAGAGVGAESGDEEDEDEDRPGVEALRAYARQITTPHPSLRPTRVLIPRRGEKDFEPLDATQRLQAKMLGEARQALVDALGGVRGGASKTISHALLDEDASPYPRVKVSRGTMFTSMGHTVRIRRETDVPEAGPSTTAKIAESHVELLPEEALYLLERGSMQIWVRPSKRRRIGGAEQGKIGERAAAETSGEKEVDADAWDEDIQGIPGTVEMSVMQGFAHFIGKDGLSLERYQVYAGLKRLGYVVQRRRAFLPDRFRTHAPPVAGVSFAASLGLGISARIRSVWARWIAVMRNALRGMTSGASWMIGTALRATGLLGRRETLLGEVGLGRRTYRSLFDRIRIIPSGWSTPISLSPTPPDNMNDTDPSSLFAPLDANPYLPLWHVWKPSRAFSKKVWDGGSERGLAELPPDFWVAVVDARSTPFPSLKQLESIFPMLPEVAPAYMRPRQPRGPPDTAKPAMSAPGSKAPVASTPADSTPDTPLARIQAVLLRLLPASLRPSTTPAPQLNVYTTLKQGDRSLIIAINDGGNIGWTRLGRGGFDEHIMVAV